ncbi:MAG: cytosine permease, partial [Candidatus Dormibacteraeota bacterium]|nr:cytosine permease [Candidatus Dormibacteraeota bacterium]
YAFPVLTAVFVVGAIVILSKSHPGLPAITAPGSGPTPGGFWIALGATFGYAAGWNPYASDYTRYLPRTTNRMAAGVWAGLGVLISCVVLELGGAALATVPTSNFNDNPTLQFIKPLPEVLAVLALLGIALGTVSANVINIYSGSMSFLTLGIRLPSHIRRAIVAAVAGVCGYVLGLILEARGVVSNYENFLLLISYWIAPFLGVVLVDYWLRRGEYDQKLFYDSGYRPWKGVVAMAAGIVVSLPFWNNALYTAPIAKANPGLGDITFVVGFVVAAAVHFALNLGLRRETAATPRSVSS